LENADVRESEGPYREHTDSGNRIQRQGTAFRGLLRNHTKHGRPKESLAEGMRVAAAKIMATP